MKANAWLARDDDKAGGNYVFSSGELRRGSFGLWKSNKSQLVVDEYQISQWTDEHLDPGQGPVPVRISIERAEEHDDA